jgi:hypothetical protein
MGSLFLNNQFGGTQTKTPAAKASLMPDIMSRLKP